MAGRSVLVTGAPRGVGRAVAVAFAAAGDRVAVHHRDSPRSPRRRWRSWPGAAPWCRATWPTRMRSFVDAAAAALGGLDVLVNNAAVFAPRLHRPSVVRAVAAGVGATSSG